MYGYTGKILHIDLKKRKTWVETKPESWYKTYIGGVSMATRLCWENIEVGCDPLAPGNPICIAGGIFAGTPVSVGGKYGMASKSPLTGFIGDSLSGSWTSVALKRTGWDGIVIHDASDEWVNVFVDDNRVEFRSAEHLLGMGTHDTEETIREELGDDQVRSAVIGPAGENMARIANVSNDGRKAGRTGHGAVWGSKKLKALSMRGTHNVQVADPDTLLKLSFDIMQSAQGPHTQKYRVLGTTSNVLNMNRLGLLPTHNYQRGTFEDAELVSGEYLHEHNKAKTIACAQCSIACEQVGQVKEGPYEGAMSHIEYESLYALAPNCGLNNMNAAIKAITNCNELGLDTMSGGVTISWALECYERGVFTQEDFKCAKYPEGFEANFGNDEAVVTLTEMIAHREGYMGDLLAEGTKRASARVDEERGTETYKWAMHIKGLEAPGYDARSLKTFALGLAAGTRGACHNRTAAYDPDIKGQVDRFSVDETRGELAKSTEEYAAVYDTLPLCKFIRRCFTGKADRAGAWPAIANLINATTGWEFDYDDVDLIGERAHTIKKAFNIREGWTRKDDHLPWRWQNEAMKEGASANCFVTDEELEYLKDIYYKAKGWTQEGLIPKEKLIELGMDDVAQEIGV